MTEPILLHGDCLTLLPTLAAGSVAAIVTDPPYGMDYQSAWRSDKTQRKAKIANDKQPFVWWLWEAYRVLQGGAAGCSAFAGGTRKRRSGWQSPGRDLTSGNT